MDNNIQQKLYGLDHLRAVIRMKEKQDIQEVRPLENVYYMDPIDGEGRGEYLSSLTALIAPSMYVEPFCGVAVEAQLCGTPVLTHDFGAMAETVEQFKTGLRCHSLADFCYGIKLAVNGEEFDSKYISERARKKWSLETVAHYYDYIIKSNLELVNGSGGWYTTTSHVDLLPKIDA